MQLFKAHLTLRGWKNANHCVAHALKSDFPTCRTKISVDDDVIVSSKLELVGGNHGNCQDGSH